MLKSFERKVIINIIISIGLFVFCLTLGILSLKSDNKEYCPLSLFTGIFFSTSTLLFVYTFISFFSLKEIIVYEKNDIIVLYMTIFSIHLFINDIDYDHILRGRIFFDRDFLTGKLQDGTSVLAILEGIDHFHITFYDKRNSISV